MRRAWSTVVIAVCLAATLIAQRGGPPQPVRSPQAMAPFDPTGYWVALVSDEWRYRMLTPPKGTWDYVPLNGEGQRVAREWDPAKDEAAGEQCRAYGAGGIMRLPIRLHITWADERTLRMDIDAGSQTRFLRFGNATPAAGKRTWQGDSVAVWEARRAARAGTPTPGRYLKVTTTNMLPGYLRKNGVPYSATAVLTEYFAHLMDDDGTRYLTVTTMLEDPVYLQQPWVRTSQFKKQADAKGWNPTPCSAR